MKYNILCCLVLVSLLQTACNDGPKVISSSADQIDKGAASTGIFSDAASQGEAASSSSLSSDIHTVKVIEVLPTSKYIYLRVSEGEEEFWIATGKQEVSVGQEYVYRGGLLKTNFESKEYNRVFDKVYLVSNIVSANHGKEVKIETHSKEPGLRSTVNEELTTAIKIPGSKTIKDIVTNASKYEGEVVQLSGKCVKINPNIMGRNWVHLKDGSYDEYDLVVTTQAPIPEGHVVTMKARVALNQDFGAGYRYDIILEDGELIR
jgi:hypothetical protein